MVKLALISHSSKVMFKKSPSQASTVSRELQDVQAVFRKGTGTRDQIANVCCIIEKAREFQKNICLIDYAKAFGCVDHNKLWKILQEMGIPDHLTCLLRNLYAGQEAIVRTGQGTIDWFQIGKGVHQDCILSPCLFNLYAEHIMQNAGLNEAQTGIRIARRNTNILRNADDTALMAESKEELESLLMKEESEKSGLKLNIQKTEMMASSPITSWQIDGVTVETVTDFIFLSSKITADSDCSHEIKRLLLLGRKAVTNLDNILKSTDISFLTKVPLLWMLELDYKESWTPENWCFSTVVLKNLVSSLDCKEIQPVNHKGNQSVLNIHWKDWYWSWNSDTVATWCEELTHWKRPWCWERLKAGGEGHDRGWDDWIVSPAQWTWVWASSRSWWWTGKPEVLHSMGSQSWNDWVTFTFQNFQLCFSENFFCFLSQFVPEFCCCYYWQQNSKFSV